MPRFFCREAGDDTVTITGGDAKHILRVLRMRPGDELTVCDLRGYDYDCVLAFGEGECVTASVLRKYPNRTEPDVAVTLYQAFPKGDKFETIVQKSVELGVSRIVPVLTSRCVARPDAASFSKKRERYQKIALEAAKQCGRGIIPEVADLLRLQEAIEEMRRQTAIVFYEGGGGKVRELVSPDAKAVSLLIGSEGGFEPEEIAACEAAGIRRGTLGRRILRCETAPDAALTLVLSAVGEL